MKYLQIDAFTSLTGRLQECRIGQRIIQGRIEAYTMKRAGNDKKYAADLGSKYVEQQESFENEWKQLVAANNLRKKSIGSDEDETQRNLQLQQHKRGRSQSVGVCQDLSKQTNHRFKHARSSSFDEVLKPTAFEVPRQLTPLGDLRDLSTRRLMTDLILTLNMTFPDYDFSSVQPHDFQQVSLQDVTQAVYSQLSPFLCNNNEADITSNGVSLVGPGSAREDGTQQTQTMLIVDLWNALDEVMNLKECDIYSWSNADMASEELWLWNFHYFFVNKTLKRIVFFTCSECMNGRLPTEEDDDGGDVEESAQMAAGSRLADAESEDANFDLDPSAAQAGGFSLSVV
jgi:hypothetical protein